MGISVVDHIRLGGKHSLTMRAGKDDILRHLFLHSSLASFDMPSELHRGIKTTAAFLASAHGLAMDLQLMELSRFVAFEGLGTVTTRSESLRHVHLRVTR